MTSDLSGSIDGDHPVHAAPAATAVVGRSSSQGQAPRVPVRGPSRDARLPRPVVASFVLSYLLGALALTALVMMAGPWNVAANTRALAALMAAGVVPLGEDDPGFGSGVPAVDLFIRSQAPVGWALVLLAAALFVVVAGLKALQFHRLAGLVGIDGTLGQHARAFVYGHGIGRMLPYRMGEVAWVAALQGQGSGLAQGAKVVSLMKGFLLFEIVTFAFIGLILNGVFDWAVSLLPPLLILLGCHLFLRTPRSKRGRRQVRAGGSSLRGALADLLREPRMLVELALLSLVSFLLVEIGSYIVPMAFSAREVPLIQDDLRMVVVNAPLIVMAVVGGYVSRLVPVTPGGIGQFEWGFALVLVVGGLPVASAVVLALLVSAVRYASGALLFAGVILTRGVETSLREVMTLFRRPAGAAAPVASPTPAGNGQPS